MRRKKIDHHCHSKQNYVHSKKSILVSANSSSVLNLGEERESISNIALPNPQLSALPSPTEYRNIVEDNASFERNDEL